MKPNERMLACTWLSSTICSVDVASGGEATRVVFVVDTVKGDENAISDVDCDVVVLCGSVLPQKLERGLRIVASEPVAQLLALKGHDHVERCQIKEKVPVKDDIVLVPTASGGQLGSCDWILYVADAPLLTFCGAKGRAPPVIEKSKHIIFGKAPIQGESSHSFKASRGISYSIVPINELTAFYVLPLARDIPNSSFNALPLWCHRAKAIHERYSESWGQSVRGNRSIVDGDGILVYVLESELDLLKQISGDAPVVTGFADYYESLMLMNQSEALKLVLPLKKDCKIHLGPTWNEVENCSSKFGSEPALVNATRFLEGEAAADVSAEVIANLMNVNLNQGVESIPIEVHGLLVRPATKDFTLQVLGNGRYRVYGTTLSGPMLEKLAKQWNQVTTSQHPGIAKRLALKQARTSLATNSVGESDMGQEKNSKVIEEKQRIPTTKRMPSPAPTELTSKPNSEGSNVKPNIVESSKISAEEESSSDRNKKQKMMKPEDDGTAGLVSLLKHHGGRMLLSDIAKLSTFGDKLQILEIVRRKPELLTISNDGGKRSIALV